MTSPFGSESMKYCSSKVLLEAKLPDQKFFRNLRQFDQREAGAAESKSELAKLLQLSCFCRNWLRV